MPESEEGNQIKANSMNVKANIENIRVLESYFTFFWFIFEIFHLRIMLNSYEFSDGGFREPYNTAGI